MGIIYIKTNYKEFSFQSEFCVLFLYEEYRIVFQNFEFDLKIKSSWVNLYLLFLSKFII